MTNKEVFDILTRITNRIIVSHGGQDECNFWKISLIINEEKEKLDLCCYKDMIEKNIRHAKKEIEKLEESKITEENIETFDFFEAIKRMENGKIVCKEGWNNFIKMSEGGYVIFKNNETNKWEKCALTKYDFKGLWAEVKEKPKTFSWDEAYRLMKEGKKVAQQNWGKHGIFIKLKKVGHYYGFEFVDCTGREFKLNPSHLESTDWYVYEE